MPTVGSYTPTVLPTVGSYVPKAYLDKAKLVKEEVQKALEALMLRSAPEKEFFVNNLLVRIHLIIAMILVDRPYATGV